MPTKPGYKLSAETRKNQSVASRKRWRKYYAEQKDSPQPTHKRCSACGEHKPLEEFSVKRVRSKSTGKLVEHPMSRCIECETARLKRYYHSQTPEQKRQLHRKQRARRDPDKQRQYARDSKRRKRGTFIVDPDSEPMPWVDPEPFLKWWNSLNGDKPTEAALGESTARAVRRALEGARKMRLHTVYDVCEQVGRPDIPFILYPDA